MVRNSQCSCSGMSARQIALDLPACSMWFACYTRANQERSVGRSCQNKNIESFLPLVPRASQWSDRLKTIWRPAFPGYIFVRTTVDGLSIVRSTAGVSYVLSSGMRPAVVRDGDIENVRRVINGLVRSGAVCELGSALRRGVEV